MGAVLDKSEGGVEDMSGYTILVCAWNLKREIPNNGFPSALLVSRTQSAP
jgi:hypothetical protein